MKNGYEFRDWQEDAAFDAYTHISSGEKFFLTQATPGGGKTIYALGLFEKMKEEGRITHCVIVVPSTNLEKQWTAESNKVIGEQLKNSMLYNGMPDFSDYSGICITYQAMNQYSEHLKKFCSMNKTLVIADEMHHVADGKSWGESFKKAFDPAAHIIGLTGTPWASGGNFIPHVEYDDSGYAVPNFTYPKRDAIADKVCRVVEFHRHKPTNLSFSDKNTGEFLGTFSTLDDAIDSDIKGAYNRTLQSLSHMVSMFNAANQQLNELRKGGRPLAGGLLVAPDIETAHKFQDEILRLTGKEYPLVHSRTDKPHKVISEFKKSSEKWLISVDMITEGVDIKRLQALVFLSNKNTELFVTQVAGRIERIISEDIQQDRTAYFHYTDTESLNQIVERMEEENRKGLAAIPPDDIVPPLTDGTGGDAPRINSISLDEVETEANGLLARGLVYEKELVAEAIAKKRQSAYLADVELFIICKFILAEREAGISAAGHDTLDVDELPLEEKKINMRKGIHDRVNARLGKYLKRKPAGAEIQAAHRHINKAIGIRGTTDDISYDQLLQKFDYVNQTGVSTWLV